MADATDATVPTVTTKSKTSMKSLVKKVGLPVLVVVLLAGVYVAVKKGFFKPRMNRRKLTKARKSPKQSSDNPPYETDDEPVDLRTPPEPQPIPKSAPINDPNFTPL